MSMELYYAHKNFQVVISTARPGMGCAPGASLTVLVKHDAARVFRTVRDLLSNSSLRSYLCV
jgi:hypothetical protein